jgi:hypothetical protein
MGGVLQAADPTERPVLVKNTDEAALPGRWVFRAGNDRYEPAIAMPQVRARFTQRSEVQTQTQKLSTDREACEAAAALRLSATRNKNKT